MPAALHSILLENMRVPFLLVFRDRQKHIYIRISERGVLSVSAPSGTGMQRIRAVLLGRSDWILMHLGSIREGMDGFDPNRSIMYCGVPVRVNLTGRADEESVLDMTSRTLTASDGNAVETWLRRQAERILRFRTKRLSERTGIPCVRVSIRNQRTRWGSSSTRGTISLNWRIVMAPPEVQRYLIIHELVHQLYQDHSKRFWAKVGEFCPEYARHGRWLKQHGVLNGLFRDDPGTPVI